VEKLLEKSKVYKLAKYTCLQ